jgi:hypothetical protein
MKIFQLLFLFPTLALSSTNQQVRLIILIMDGLSFEKSQITNFVRPFTFLILNFVIRTYRLCLKVDNDDANKPARTPLNNVAGITSLFKVINTTASNHSDNEPNDSGPLLGYPFHIRSFMERSYEMGMCLTEKFGNSGKNKFVAAVCDPESLSQQWMFDELGYVHNMNVPGKCLKKQGNKLIIDNCSKTNLAAMKLMNWIYATDGSIRLGSNALVGLAISKKFMLPSKQSKKVAPVGTAKINNRFPNANEKWMLITKAPPIYPYRTESPSTYPTLEPTANPTAAPTSKPSVNPTVDYTSPTYSYPTVPNDDLQDDMTGDDLYGPNDDMPGDDVQGTNDDGGIYYGKASTHPASSPSHPPVGDKNNHTHNFNIQLVNMGVNHNYDDAFFMAKMKLEDIIIGDLLDYEPSSDSNHDWFGGEWPNKKTNVHVDDVLIGYEITDIDGVQATLGLAGPTYIRHENNTATGTFKTTTISG